MNQAAMSVYVVCISALALNLFFLTILTVMRRGKAKSFVNPEDAKAFKGENVKVDAPEVLRAAAAHRNALENFVPFAILGLLFVMTGASKTAALAYFITFAAARWLHSLFYLASMQPLRTLAFLVGLLVNLGLTYHVIVAGLV
jgi:uncharacterized MAPEG superfamily protein